MGSPMLVNMERLWMRSSRRKELLREAYLSGLLQANVQI